MKKEKFNPKMTRRQVLKAGMIGGAGLMLPLRWARKASAQTIMDPLYTAPILDPATVPQFINPLPVVQALGLRKDVTGGGTVQVGMGQTTQNLLGAGFGPTPVWGYAVQGIGVTTYPGATFVAQSGVPVEIQYRNLLPNQYVLRQGNPNAGDVVDNTLHWAYGPGNSGGTFAANGIPVVTHLHGGHTASIYDGLPEQWFSANLQGPDFTTQNYTYLNDQEAATLWYHDHALGITRTNVYAGLAGFYLLRDANENQLIDTGAIPSGDYEIEIVIQDRMFYPDGRLAYPDAALLGVQPSAQPEFFGQIILVNGKAWPFLNVEPRQYRFRLLNGSDSRFYNLWFAPSTSNTGPPFMVIGNDTGLLNNPVPVNQLTIGPGERYDVVVDFSAFAGQALVVKNNARIPFPKGETVNPMLDGRIMVFRVGNSATGPGPLAPVTATTNLRPVSGPIPAIPTGLPVRKLMLFEATDTFGRLQPLLGTVNPNPPAGDPTDGTFLWDDQTTESPVLDSTEIWEVYNATVDAHPIHLHLVQFQIVNRQRFTATVVPKTNGTSTGGALRNVSLKGQPQGPGAFESGFKDTAIMYPGEVTRVVATFDKAGEWVWHCHILSHEDHEMMRRFEVVT